MNIQVFVATVFSVIQYLCAVFVRQFFMVLLYSTEVLSSFFV
jgi:hypothetical protein